MRVSSKGRAEAFQASDVSSNLSTRSKMAENLLGKFVVVIKGPFKGAFGFIKFRRAISKLLALKLTTRLEYKENGIWFSYPNFIDISAQDVRVSDPKIITMS